jgi:hypothetical protein
MQQIQKEFQMAEDARQAGLEGLARVCARRAAGIAVREFLTSRGIQIRTSNAHDLLQLLADLPSAPEQTREIARHLTQKVDFQFQLPPDLDLIAEARTLITILETPPPTPQSQPI